MVDMINISARHPCLYIINTAAGIAIVLLLWSSFLYIIVTLYSPNDLQRSGNTEIRSKSVKTTHVNHLRGRPMMIPEVLFHSTVVAFPDQNIETCSVQFYYYLEQ